MKTYKAKIYVEFDAEDMKAAKSIFELMMDDFEETFNHAGEDMESRNGAYFYLDFEENSGIIKEVEFKGGS